MKIQHIVVIAAIALPAFAAAQPAPVDPTAPPVASTTEAPAPTVVTAAGPTGPAAPSPIVQRVQPGARFGAEIALLPSGSLSAAANNQTISVDTATAVGLGAIVQFPLNDIFTIDIAPRLLFNVKGTNDTDSATELDLRARLTAGGYVAPSVRLYAAAAPGYSIIFPPDTSGGGIEMSNPKGFTVGLAAGAAFAVQPRMQLTTEVGYQFGFQSTTVTSGSTSVDADLKSNYLHLAVGMLFDL